VPAATWSVATGAFAAGPARGWVFALRDGLDGKLVRLKPTGIGFAKILDHGLDIVRPPFGWPAPGPRSRHRRRRYREDGAGRLPPGGASTPARLAAGGGFEPCG
jgi:hypothetical protein